MKWLSFETIIDILNKDYRSRIQRPLTDAEENTVFNAYLHIGMWLGYITHNNQEPTK